MPILALLAGKVGVVAIAAILSYCLWRNTVPFFKKDPKLHAPKEADSDTGNDDRIRQLPDELLSEVLSRLPLIEAVRMRILSRRWRNISEHRSELKFPCCLDMFGRTAHRHENYSPYLKRRFLKAVHHSLLRYSAHKITAFHLTFCLWKEYASEFRLWMQYVARLEVEVMSFSFMCCPFNFDGHGNMIHHRRPWEVQNDMIQEGEVIELFAFPFQLLFEAPALERLYLSFCTLQPGFKGQFNSLKVLDLFLMPVDNGEIPTILSSCLNLQKLTIRHCKLPSKLCISGECLQLKSLWIIFCPGLKEIELCAGNLTTFDCCARGMIRYSLHFVPELKNIYACNNGCNTFPCMIGEVAKHCPQLESLLFQTETDKVQHIPLKMNMFSKLRHLYLLMGIDSKFDLFHFTPILDACPLLLQLHLMAGSEYRNEQIREWPASRHAKLKKVKIYGFRATRNEIEFLSYMVRSTPALELLKVRSSYRRYTGGGKWAKGICCRWSVEENELIFELLMGQAISSKAEIRFRR